VRRHGQSAPAFIAGFVEGLLAPVFELVVVVILSAFAQAGQGLSTGAPPFYLFLALLFIIDLVRSVAIGLSHSEFAVGNVIGNVFGIYIFYSSLSTVSAQAANDSLIFTVAMVVSFVLGLVALATGSSSI
jgi:hypothetical protein